MERSQLFRGSSDEPSPIVNIEFHQTFAAHFQKEGLAGFLIHDIGAFHDLVDFERFRAERAQDILSIIQHDCSPPSPRAFVHWQGSGAPRKCGAVLFTCETRTTESCELLIASAHQSEQTCSGKCYRQWGREAEALRDQCSST